MHAKLKTGLAALAVLVAGTLHAEEVRPRILSDGGPLHHHALHAQNPILARYKGLYPRIVSLKVDDTDQEFTILNEGPSFQVAEGSYGDPNLLIEIETAEIEKVYEAVQSGSMSEGIPRIEMAMILAEYTQESSSNPPSADKKPNGPGPKLSKRESFLVDFIKVKDKGIKFMGKAGAAKAAGKKLGTLYYGLISKLAFKKADKLSEKTAKYLISEMARDLESGSMGLTPGAWWSKFVDLSCFYAMIRSPQNFAGTCEILKDKIKGLLMYHKTLPASGDLATRSEILEDRLAIVEKLLELADI